MTAFSSLMFWHNIKVIFLMVIFGLIILKILNKYLNQKRIFIGLFLILLLIPFVQTKTNLIQYRPLEENRKKLTLPTGNPVIEIFNNQKTYTLAYEKYFNDNYGLRDLLIRIKNQIDYTFFHVSDEVLLGKDNWLFYKSVVEKEQIYMEQQSEDQFLVIQNKMISLNNYFKKRNILFVVMPIPLKNSIYPELYINRTTNRPSPTKFERFITFLQTHPEIRSIDARSVLLNNKDKYQLFYKTDFHWTDTAAYLVNKETVESINKWIHGSTKWSYSLQTQEDNSFTGGQTDSLATLVSPREVAIHVINSPKGSTPDPKTPKPFLYYFKSSLTNQKLLPKTLLIGNSYFLNMLNTGFVDHFNEFLMIHSNDMDKIPASVTPDIKIVIWQLIEVDLLKGYLFQQ